jgi:ABC-type oligopeptide transport system substrate-binding subunit
VESAQYQGLIQAYNFDMVFARWGVSLSPGNEQQNFWSSKTADAPGGRNLAGVADAAVDRLIEAVVAARTRAELVAAARALDRVLMWHHYVVPLYHRRQQWTAHWDRIGIPATTPLAGVQLNAFWATGAPD